MRWQSGRYMSIGAFIILTSLLCIFEIFYNRKLFKVRGIKHFTIHINYLHNSKYIDSWIKIIKILHFK